MINIQHLCRICCAYLLLISLMAMTASTVGAYRVGVGRADCTGPPVEITFMGYAQLSQRGAGIHLRQFSRAFIFEESGKRAVFVSVDAGMMGHAVKRDVLAVLQKKYGDLYNVNNVAISGSHTHSTPGGFLMYLLYDMTSLGFVSETFNALVRGIAQSIIRAHNNMIEARVFVSEIDVQEANINRSPSAYENNPEEEKSQYKDNVDKRLVQMRMVNKKNVVFGAINWFAVHPTSMNNTNRFVSSDNVGYASILLEQEQNKGSLIGKGEFVGVFASSNLGDVSPNIMGPKCEKTGLPCDVLTSSCPSGAGACFASGPGKDMYESTKIIATRLYNAGSQLLSKAGGREVTGPVNFVHQFVDMTKAEALYYNPRTRVFELVRGCLPAMGYSFAAGTTDGPGAFDFQQGTVTDNALWNVVRDFIAEPTADDKECQAPKPILLATGRAKFPYDWQPKIVPTQILLIGDFAIAAVPGEFTTMSGRRLRNEISRASVAAGGSELQVVVAGLSNMYSSYITTPEEYEIQRYEGASTLYGPHTLTIYLTQYKNMIKSLVTGEKMDAGPTPPYQDDKQISLMTGVIFDGHPIGREFGSVKVQPLNTYERGDVVYTTFVTGNPRNNLMHDKTFFTVEQKQIDGNWTVIATDANWETKFKWERQSTILGFSDVEFQWEIGPDCKHGTYRIRHFGYYRYILGGIYPFTGSTKTFVVG
ncbi:neutral ceramidase [Wyeomyia smithii]|uniref:neutral ceramidase n=1 Tax=Wyeomyia smithii TaxID=174621 RepID=UPI002467BB31|nr:neutral ceramidase [Wyeomyia smithii]XP_055525448.1 neutral ceramidase [Wyeomyia smithii]XP_055525449.1 neutral ceramidase [Wyeomyia smithii]XP_055525450.1 neutral ceramidase [Wyeomyia smithii]XP_055525451.1 neutral ceramidase [Wyeomyia smithii]XP_055525452.1 neutral ceramidase [Wyeomyia smithii]XP_055525454.1 neutral ceramidase [Wyeomyia smithii]XP_055525455.1 neutral ceramidase [Wyeomyia smithii]